MSHYPPFTPHLASSDPEAALDFYTRALDAKETLRLTMPDGRIAHAEMDVNNAKITFGLAGEMFGLVAPDPDGPVQVVLTLSVPDVDAAYAKALEAGATSANEPADQFHGDRTAAVRDPFGHRWVFQQHLEDLTQEQMQERMDRAMS
jgi:PhnB protein